MTRIFEHFFSKLLSILQTIWGWVMASFLFLIDYFSGHRFVVFLVVAVTIIDAVWGIAVSFRLGKFTLSELARLTIAKFAVYGCAMFVFVGLDKIADTVLSAAVVGSLIILVEFWSSSASMLIMFPNMPFLRLMKKALTGEIAAKLHVDPHEVESILNGNEDTHRQRTRK